MKITEKKLNKTFFSFKLIQKWSKEIILGLDFLHLNNVIHRDLKPANFFLKENSLKIGDFGEAVLIINGDRLTTTNSSNKNNTYRGTPAYMSPEMYSFHNEFATDITFKTDVWSAGIIIYELINLKMPIPAPVFSTDTPDDLKLIVNL